MLKNTFRTTLIAAALLAGGAAQAQPALAEIKVSYQPALYWALPFFVASEKNWWAEVGLKPVFSTFPAGVPQRRRSRGTWAAPAACRRCWAMCASASRRSA
jgi:ABC-type nitrate/sulfonate/bicarbonate transport system substrate-binding protein